MTFSERSPSLKNRTILVIKLFTDVSLKNRTSQKPDKVLSFLSSVEELTMKIIYDGTNVKTSFVEGYKY